MTTSSDRPIGFLVSFYTSPIGKKVLSGLTGLGLGLFVLVHMVGNLTLLLDTQAYNQLAHFIDSWGILLYGLEFILLGLGLVHILVGLSVRLNSRQARPEGYSQLKTVGGESKQSLSSRTMLVSGLILLGFLIWHLTTFKFGTYYPTAIAGVEMRDLARLVQEKFHQPLYAFGYSGVMVLLALHLRHGLWSAWQSIGVLNSKISPLVYSLALVLSGLITLGFVILPLGIFWGWLN